jgi:hypothetical protein
MMFHGCHPEAAVAPKDPEDAGTRNAVDSFSIEKARRIRFSFVPLCLRGQRFYFDIAANSSECSSDWNLLSSVLNCMCSREASLSTLMLSSAIFSTPVAPIFL